MAVGAPDYIVGLGVPLGYAETKEVGIDLSRSEQLKRYREAFPNLILTDYLKFQRTVVALTQTLRSMREIDAKIPGWPLE